jgi:hypothetical protein
MEQQKILQEILNKYDDPLERLPYAVGFLRAYDPAFPIPEGIDEWLQERIEIPAIRAAYRNGCADGIIKRLRQAVERNNLSVEEISAAIAAYETQRITHQDFILWAKHKASGEGEIGPIQAKIEEMRCRGIK